jgi:hypothetical protein
MITTCTEMLIFCFFLPLTKIVALLFACKKPSLTYSLTDRRLHTKSRSPKKLSSDLTFGNSFELLNLGTLENQQRVNVLKLDDGGSSTKREARNPSTACFNRGIMLAG